MLDLSAAFDTVDQERLLNNFFALGIEGIVLEWFRTYLKNMIFRVCVNDTLSHEFLMKTGVSQGSILGPILFLIYTIELYYVLESLRNSYHSNADDSQIYFIFESISEAEKKLGVIVNKVDEWMQSRRPKLNSDKTECILVTSVEILTSILLCSAIYLSNFLIAYGTLELFLIVSSFWMNK